MIDTWWARMPPLTADTACCCTAQRGAVSHVRLYPQTHFAHGAYAAGRAAAHLYGDPVCARWPGGAVPGRGQGRRGRLVPKARGMAYRGAQGVDPQRLEQIKALYGFDKPAHERFVQMLGQFARFDLGPASPEQRRLGAGPREAAGIHQPGAVDFFISYLVAVPLGIAKAVRAGSRFDLVTTLADFGGLCHSGLCAGRGAAGDFWRAAADGFRCAG